MSRISYVSTLSQHIPMFCWKNLYVYNHLDVDMRFKEFAQLTEELLKYPYSIYWITMHIYIYLQYSGYTVLSQIPMDILSMDIYGYILDYYAYIYTVYMISVYPVPKSYW